MQTNALIEFLALRSVRVASHATALVAVNEPHRGAVIPCGDDSLVFRDHSANA